MLYWFFRLERSGSFPGTRAKKVRRQHLYSVVSSSPSSNTIVARKGSVKRKDENSDKSEKKPLTPNVESRLVCWAGFMAQKNDLSRFKSERFSGLFSKFSGVVTSVVDGCFTVKGLSDIRSGALITFQKPNTTGFALSLFSNDTVGAVTLKGTVNIGNRVFGERT